MEKRKFAPVPIFNAKKRIRQALIAEPQSQNNIQRVSSDNHYGRMPDLFPSPSTTQKLDLVSPFYPEPDINSTSVSFPSGHTRAVNKNYTESNPPYRQQARQTTPVTKNIRESQSNTPSRCQSGQTKSLSRTFQERNPPGSQASKVKSTVKDKSRDISQNSLQIVMTNTGGIKHLSKYKGVLNLIFEIYGLLDSAVVANRAGTAKEFTLRDEFGQLQCIFYEIDRTVPRLTRGYLYRIVGSYDEKQGKMKCFSIRPCSSAERAASKENASFQEEYINQLTKSFREQ